MCKVEKALRFFGSTRGMTQDMLLNILRQFYLGNLTISVYTASGSFAGWITDESDWLSLSSIAFIFYWYLIWTSNDTIIQSIFSFGTANMPKSTVFITGASGFIGAQVTLLALRADYDVKLSVRREAQIDSLRRAFSKFADHVTFVVIPDYTKAEAFDTALQGAEHVIHVASPLPKSNEEDLLTPAVKGTTSILESASRVLSIKKVVITASVASLVPLGKGADGTIVKGKC